MADCVETETTLDRALVQATVVTNADLVLKIRQLRVDLQNCNADKAALRSWTKGMVQ